MRTKTIMGALCVVLLATGAFAGEEQGEMIRGTVDDFVAATATDEYRVELRADGDLGEAPEDAALVWKPLKNPLKGFSLPNPFGATPAMFVTRTGT